MSSVRYRRILVKLSGEALLGTADRRLKQAKRDGGDRVWARDC